jgi:cell division protein FtsW (lipid II flippase)
MSHRRFSKTPLATGWRLLAAVATVVFLGQSVAGQMRWLRLAPFPEPSEELYGVAANGKMYVLGGLGDGLRI